MKRGDVMETPCRVSRGVRVHEVVRLRLCFAFAEHNLHSGRQRYFCRHRGLAPVPHWLAQVYFFY